MSNEILCIIILVLACIAILGYLYWMIKKNGLRAFVVKLIVTAEQEFEKGANQDKINYVIDGLLAFLPKILRCFITRENVKTFVQRVFDDVKEALDYRG